MEVESYIRELTKSASEHKRCRMEPLADLFPQTMGYHFEKLNQGVYESGPEKAAHAGMGLGGLRNIRGVLASVHEALARRGHELDAHSGIGNLYAELRYPIEKLEAFLEAKHANGTVPIDEAAALIFVFFLRAKVEELREIVRRIDEEADAN